jgi:hypothetical protein
VDIRLYKRISGVNTQLGSSDSAAASGDVIYLEIQGTTIVVKKNGSHICGSPIDASAEGIPSSGEMGINVLRSTSGGTVKLDDFAAGDFSGGGGGITLSQVERGRTVGRGILRGA